MEVRRETHYNDRQAELILQSIEPLAPVNDALVNLRRVKNAEKRCSLQYYLPPEKTILLQQIMLDDNHVSSIHNVAEIPATHDQQTGFLDIETITSENGKEAIHVVGLTDRTVEISIPDKYRFTSMQNALLAIDKFDPRLIARTGRPMYLYGRTSHERTALVPDGYTMAVSHVHCELKDKTRIGDFTFIIAIAYADAPVKAVNDDQDD